MKAKEYISDITKCLDLSREWVEAELAARDGVMTMTFTDYQTEISTLFNRLQSVDIDPLLLELATHSKERIRAMCVSLSRIKIPIRVNPHTYECVDEIPMQYWKEPWAEAYNSTWRLAADFVKGIIDECGFDGFDDLCPSSDEHRTSSDDGIGNRRLEALIREQTEIIKALTPHQKEEEQHREYSKELVALFRGHTDLIEELEGKTDEYIAARIKELAKKRDKNGKMFIENPNNSLQSKFARLLKDAGIIKKSVDRFSRDLK